MRLLRLFAQIKVIITYFWRGGEGEGEGGKVKEGTTRGK